MFKKFDIFGSQILLRFKGDHTYNTKFGSFFSLLIITFISFRLFFIIKDVFQRSSPQVIYNERQVDDPELFEATNKSFPISFALEHPLTYEPYIDNSIYNLQAYWQQKKLVFNTMTQQYDSVWEKQLLDVKPCTPENFANPENQHYFLNLKYQNMYCISSDAILKIQGDFPSAIYSEISIFLSRCKENCKNSDVLDYYLLKAYFGLQISDVYVDPNIKENPFKSYARDMYFPTSTKLPKEVEIYLRNNYVQSDYGWILEDIHTQKFPSFSYYVDNVYPEGFQSYFLKVTFRFEKQKESVYQRKYKNFNSIVSEIGGFTQSLLAIGLLICSRVSQLNLNQEIINQAYNYEEISQIERQEEEKLKMQLEQNLIKSQQQQKDGFIKQTHLKSNQIEKNQQNLLQQQIKVVNRDTSNSSQIVTPSQTIKKDLEYNNITPQSNNTTLNNPSRFQTGKKVKLKKESLELSQLQYQEQIVVKPQGDEYKQQFENKEKKKILNFILQDQIASQEAILGEFLDGSKQKEKILKQKQKIIEQEQKLKENVFKQLMDKQTKSMRMSLWEYFKSTVFPFGELKKKKEVINYSINKLYQNLDIFSILKKLIEVEKLKKLLLDQDQMKLFDYLPKPTIYLDQVLKKNAKESKDQKHQMDDLYQDNRSEIQKAKDAYQAYKSILNKDNHSVLDKKIIDLLDPNLVAVFQEQIDINSQIEVNIQQSKDQSPQQISQQLSPLKISSQQFFSDQNIIQDNSFLKNEEIIKQDILSHRSLTDTYPIYQQNSQRVQKEQNLYKIEESERQNIINGYQNAVLIKQEQQQKVVSTSISDISDIAIEQQQQYPNQFMKQKIYLTIN